MGSKIYCPAPTVTLATTARLPPTCVPASSVVTTGLAPKVPAPAPTATLATTHCEDLGGNPGVEWCNAFCFGLDIFIRTAYAPHNEYRF